MKTCFRTTIEAENYLDFYFDGELFVDNTPIPPKDSITEKIFNIFAKSTQSKVGKMEVLKPISPKKFTVIIRIASPI